MADEPTKNGQNKDAQTPDAEPVPASDAKQRPQPETDSTSKPADSKSAQGTADDSKPTNGAAPAADAKKETKAKSSGAKPAAGAKKKRKIKAPSDTGRVYIQATFNNTIVSFTDHNGRVLTWGSPGAAGFKGTRKSTPYAATLATQAAAERAKQAGLKTVAVYVRGVGSGRDAAVRALQASGLGISLIEDLTPTAHNGVRAKKPRRV